ncbi:unnamed protein product [Symbiodinium necroappetens]|uniref:Transmembrane protein n=1 Tax=Symbiodinium necroappetens TaxID=1628268 RepID=A0A812RLM4_9DINO|nr:unnamed protein product [Symbiodinium necroappetens]
MPAKAQRYGKLAQDETKAGLRARKTRPDSDSETEDESKLSEREIAKKKWVRRLRWAWRKLTAAFWVSLACFTIYYTNFFRVMWESPLVNRTYFYLAFACLAFNMSMLGYLALWCTVVLKIEEPWETKHPKAIPVMAIVGFSTVWLFFFALWPVWGLLTLVIQLIFFLGFVSAGQFLPSGTPGAVLMFVIFFGAFFTSELIPHEGLAHYTPGPSSSR